MSAFAATIATIIAALAVVTLAFFTYSFTAAAQCNEESSDCS
jgi:hypothetical protein